MKRDRHGRGGREIYTATSFDSDLFEGVERIKEVWGSELQGVEFAWSELPDPLICDGEIPLGRTDGRRVTIFRLPIQLRSESAAESAQLIFDTLVEQVAEILLMQPSDIHEDYGRD